MPGYRILVADDHPLFRDAMKQALAGVVGRHLIDEAGSLDSTIAAIEKNGEPDLILLDLKMPGAQGLSGLIYLRSQYPGVPVVIVSASDEPQMIRRAMGLGASGFIPKSTPVTTICQAVARILAGDVWIPDDLCFPADPDPEADDLARRLAALTPQQVRVLMMLREGLLNKQIAFNLGISEATIKQHVSAILQKLNFDSRTQAVIAASRIDGAPANGAS
jgi:DNA-binding NarL/FixJ family response regulator